MGYPPQRLDPPIPLETPKGTALAHFLQDCGDERDMLWTCFHEDGQIWTWSNEEVRACRNVTLCRGNPEKPERRDPLAALADRGRSPRVRRRKV
jgi:hypothetical protein